MDDRVHRSAERGTIDKEEWTEFLHTKDKVYTDWDEVRKEIELSFLRKRDNIYRVFGTYNLIRVLSPSFRNVPFTGLEWSFWFKDSGFDANGVAFPETERDLEKMSS